MPLRHGEKALAENVNSKPGCYLRLNSGRDVVSGVRWLAFKRVSSSSLYLNEQHSNGRFCRDAVGQHRGHVDKGACLSADLILPQTGLQLLHRENKGWRA